MSITATIYFNLIFIVIIINAQNPLKLMRTPPIEIQSGFIDGIKVRATNNDWYLSFRGIPYAEPPIGQRRFQAPAPYINRWEKVRHMDKYKPHCIGLDNFEYHDFGDGIDRVYDVSGDEDCLYLNIHLRNFNQHPQPVIFFLHDGGFSYGAPQNFEPDYLMENPDVIFINPSYRVGPLGFFCSGDGAIKGNMGLKDQVMALKWVRQNIANFSGDPDRITVSGLGAGAASTHFMYFSRMTKGMFSVGYSFSGTAMSPWALTSEATLVERSQKLAQSVGCLIKDTYEMANCLTTKDPGVISYKAQSLLGYLYNPFALFTPFVDLGYEGRYFEDYPLKMLTDLTFPRLPWVTSFTLGDGIYPAAEYMGNSQRTDHLKRYWSMYLPDILFFNNRCAPAFEDMTSIYRQSLSKDSYHKLLNFITDRNYIRPVVQSVEFMSKMPYNSIYVYSHGLQGTSTARLLSNIKPYNFRGISHGDDTLLIFGHPKIKKVDSFHPEFSNFISQIFIGTVFARKPPIQFDWPVFHYEKKNYIEFSPVGLLQKIDMILKTDYRQAEYKQFDKYFDGCPV